jgi:predicted DNA-binding transcriptional regulator YafY
MCVGIVRIAHAAANSLRKLEENALNRASNSGIQMKYVPFSKTHELLRLADMAAAREDGVSLEEIKQTFGVTLRSAQRMTQALTQAFPSIAVSGGKRGEPKRWSLAGDERLLHLKGIRDDELSALDMSIRRAEREGAITEARALAALRDRLVVLHSTSEVVRAEADAEATLQARGHACRPGPSTAYDPAILEIIDLALKGPFRLEITYLAELDDVPRLRIVEPYGVLFGTRCYLACRDLAADERIRNFRVDRILNARRLNDSFQRKQGFDLKQHVARAFESFHSETEFGTVIWRFSSRAARAARSYVFHPNQTIEDDDDGGLIVSFEAAGWLEMAWHLYKWGDTVEVIAPEQLRRMVDGHRRDDFPSLP